MKNVITIEPNSLSDSTRLIQDAIDNVSKNGGGTVRVLAGQYYLKYLDLKSNLNLNLENGAHLYFSDNFSDFPKIRTRYEGVEIDMHHPDIYGSHIKNVSITGQGLIDGCGQKWWELYEKGKKGPLINAPYVPFEYSRPFLIAFDYCQGIKVEGVTLTNSPAWTVHPLESKDVVISGVTIDNPLDSPNTDGIDPESCTDVKIIGNTISDGDDCIAIKSGIEVTKLKTSSRNIIISNNIMKFGHGGVVLGSEMSGGIENIVISNNIFDHTDRGIRMKTRRGRGGFIKNVVVSDIVMNDVLSPLTINEFYGKSGIAKDNYLLRSLQPVNEGTPYISNIKLNNIVATGVRSVAAFVYGLPESCVTNLSLTNYQVVLSTKSKPEEPEMIDDSEKIADSGLWFENTKNAYLSNVEVVGARTGRFVHKDNNDGLKDVSN